MPLPHEPGEVSVPVMFADSQLLPGRQREVVIRQAMLDEDLDAVAAKLGITYGAAAQLVYRARRLLARANEGFGAGMAVLGGRLSAARMRLRTLWLRPIEPALAALPAVLLASLLAAGPTGAQPRVPATTASLPSIVAEVAAVRLESPATPAVVTAPHLSVAPAGSAAKVRPEPRLSPPSSPPPTTISLPATAHRGIALRSTHRWLHSPVC